MPRFKAAEGATSVAEAVALHCNPDERHLLQQFSFKKVLLPRWFGQREDCPLVINRDTMRLSRTPTADFDPAFGVREAYGYQ